MSNEAYRPTRRDALKLLGGTAGAVMLGASGGAAAAALSPGDTARQRRSTWGRVAAASSTASAPLPGGTLVVAKLAEPTDLTFFPQNAAPAYHVYIPAVFDTLIKLDGNFQPQPNLAESFDVSPDKTRYQLNLRQGVEYHTGREFTAEDVLWTLQRVLDPELGMAKYAPNVAALTNMEATDDYTVVLESDNPNVTLMRALTIITMLDRETLEGPNASSLSVGTGPFKMAEYVPGQITQYVRNENYWQSGKPYLDGVTQTIVRDVQAIDVALRTGDVHVTDELGGTDAAGLEAEGLQILVNDQSPVFQYLAVDTTKPALADKRVRQALNYAYDRATVEEVNTAGTPTTVPWIPGSSAFKDEYLEMYPFDLDKARALLDEAGVSDLKFSLPVLNQGSLNEQAAEVLRSNLAEIGVEVDVESLPFNEWQDRYNGDHDLLINALLSDPDPAVAFSQTVLLRPGNDQTHFDDPEYAELVAQIVIEPDEAKAEEMAARLTEILLDECPLMPTSQIAARFVAAKEVRGLGFEPITSNLTLAETSLTTNG